MKRFSISVAIVCLLVMCFTMFTACSGSASKVVDYAEKLKEADSFVYVMNESTKIDDTHYKEWSKEVLVSGNKMQILNVYYDIVIDKDGDKVYTERKSERDNMYYELKKVVDKKTKEEKTIFNVYTIKGESAPTVEEKTYNNEIKNTFDSLKKVVADMAITEDKLEYNKEAKAFTISGVANTLVTAKSGCLEFTVTDGSKVTTYGFMNMGTARVPLPVVSAK